MSEKKTSDLPAVYPKTQHSILTIELPLFRFVPGKRKLVKRPHRKAHGMFSLKEISRLTADTWKTVDGETLEYLTVAARLISERYKQIETDLGGPLAKKPRSKSNKKAILVKQPPKVVSASVSAGVYGTLRSVSNDSKGIKDDLCLEPLNLHDVDGFWEGAAACSRDSLPQGASAIGQSVISGLQPLAGLKVGEAGEAYLEEIRRLCLPGISDLETNWESAIACPQARPRPSRRASVGHTAPVSHGAVMSHLKPLTGLTAGGTSLKEPRRLSLPNFSDLKANGDVPTCPTSSIEHAAMQQASMFQSRPPVQAQLLEMQRHARLAQLRGIGVAQLLNNKLPLSATSNQDFPFAIDGRINISRQNGSTNHFPIITSFGTSDSIINSEFNGQGSPEFGLGSDGKYRESVVSLDSSVHSIVTSRHPSPDIIGSVEARPSSGIVHQMTREDCTVDLLIDRLVQGDMSDAVDMSDDDITQMLSSSG